MARISARRKLPHWLPFLRRFGLMVNQRRKMRHAPQRTTYGPTLLEPRADRNARSQSSRNEHHSWLDIQRRTAADLRDIPGFMVQVAKKRRPSFERSLWCVSCGSRRALDWSGIASFETSRRTADRPYGATSSDDDGWTSTDPPRRPSAGFQKDHACAYLGEPESSPLGVWLESLGHVLTRPYLCWTGAAVTIIWWHVPMAFAWALRFPVVHAVELATFVASGFLFWWPVIEPWPAARLWPRWSMPLYLFAATLPCDVLSAFLSFSDHVIYVNYQTTSVHLGMTALEDQQCAGASMWVCVTVIMLLPAAFITVKHLSPGSDAFQ